MTKAAKRIAELEAALAVYANPDHWGEYASVSGLFMETTWQGPGDGPDAARTALGLGPVPEKPRDGLRDFASGRWHHEMVRADFQRIAEGGPIFFPTIASLTTDDKEE